VESLAVLGVFSVIAALLLLPLTGLALLERALGGPTIEAHALVNIMFLVWAGVDLFFTQHYAHGPNSMFLIFPGFLAFAAFYGILFPWVAPKAPPQFKKVRALAVLVYLIAFGGLSVVPSFFGNA